MADILFAELNPEEVQDAVLSTYEQITGKTLYPADPVRLFLEALAYTLIVQNGVINLAGRQNLLAFAEGKHLDYIGMMVGTSRLGSSRASCRQAFYLKEALNFAVTVPAGTRVVTGDGRAAFATVENCVIAAGETWAEAACEACEPGAAMNGLVPGQISRLIDPVPYVERTANVTASLLGSDVEGDDRYRERIRQAPEAFSCAGPAGAYQYYALAAHPDISAVTVWSPVPGTVDVRPVLKGGELPPDNVLEAVREQLNADHVRPLTDTVTVQAPELASFDIDFTWYLGGERQAMLATTTRAVEDAVEEYRIWQRTQPGRDILPLRLASLLERAGVKRIEMRSPSWQKLEGWQLAREREINIVFGGVE